MKKELFFSFLSICLVMSGCASKKQQIQEEKPIVAVEQKQETQPIVETIVEPVVEPKEDTSAYIDEFNAFAKNNNIYFEYGKSNVNEKALIKKYQQQLEKINKVEGTKLVINGYCDNISSVQFNNELGQKRANSVAKVIKKISNNDINVITKSYGKNKYKKYVKNVNENNKLNRKVEIIASK